MSAIGRGKSMRKEACAGCQREFHEDKLDLVPYTKTGKMELLCPTCKSGIAGDIEGETKGVKRLKDVKITETKQETTPDECVCALLPQCSAVGFYEGFDNFSNKAMKAYFVRDSQQNYFKVDFCPFCGKRLYKK